MSLVLASTTLLGAPAHALPVYTTGDMDANSNASEGSPTACTVVQNPSPIVSNVPVVENGPATTVSASNSGTVTNDGDGTDTISFATQVSVTGKMTAAGGNPDTLDISSTGSVQATASKPVSACELGGYSYGDLDFGFTLTQPGFMDITLDATKHTYSEFYLFDDAGNDYVELYGFGLQFSGTQRVYLPAGVYGGYLESDAVLSEVTSTLAATQVATTIHADFDLVGAQTAAPVGKAGKYVALPGARACATDSLDATVTPKKKRAENIKLVKFFVNDKLAAKTKTPTKGAVVKVPVADKVQADLKAVVTLVKKKNGKPGKTYEVEASYEACS
ncbi:hypothetical protein [Nocardioides sp.]|uniref:hypothetical protein n=1 Tax=Nocardioides sp. TaxID=35761 RepID=UPI001A294A55|nr:hypothetical protein [Nocardioides sp.]MBJ7356917.1 hypothetical protein [Nocardioides sp.]